MKNKLFFTVLLFASQNVFSSGSPEGHSDQENIRPQSSNLNDEQSVDSDDELGGIVSRAASISLASSSVDGFDRADSRTTDNQSVLTIPASTSAQHIILSEHSSSAAAYDVEGQSLQSNNVNSFCSMNSAFKEDYRSRSGGAKSVSFTGVEAETVYQKGSPSTVQDIQDIEINRSQRVFGKKSVACVVTLMKAQQKALPSDLLTAAAGVGAVKSRKKQSSLGKRNFSGAGSGAGKVVKEESFLGKRSFSGAGAGKVVEGTISQKISKKNSRKRTFSDSENCEQNTHKKDSDNDSDTDLEL